MKKLPYMKELQQKKKRIKRRKNKKLQRKHENRFCNYTNLFNYIMCRKTKNNIDDRGIDSDNTDSEGGDNYDSGFSGDDEEEDLLDENDQDLQEYDDSSGSEEDEIEEVAVRTQIKPHPRMRKHLNQSVKTGANYMWSYRPEELKVKSSSVNNNQKKKRNERKG